MRAHKSGPFVCERISKSCRLSASTAPRSLRSEFAVPVGSGHAAVHEEVAAGDERAIRAHEQRADGSDLVRSAGAPGRRELDHAPVSLAARAGQLVLGERRDDDAGADRVDPRAALAPAHRLGHHAQRVAALGNLVGVKRSPSPGRAGASEGRATPPPASSPVPCFARP